VFDIELRKRAVQVERILHFTLRLNTAATTSFPLCPSSIQGATYTRGSTVTHRHTHTTSAVENQRTQSGSALIGHCPTILKHPWPCKQPHQTVPSNRFTKSRTSDCIMALTNSSCRTAGLCRANVLFGFVSVMLVNCTSCTPPHSRRCC
jgi:hypothetical protein